VDDSINTQPGAGQSPSANAGGVLLGQLLGERYRIVGEIGKGGMATVYVAEHMLIGRQVAIKVLHPQFTENAEYVRRFLAEGRTVGTLGHPNIVESTDMGFTANGAPFMVLELLEGSNLEDEIQRCGKLPIARAIHISLQIASALAAAHAKGIIHRDLKTTNVFLVDQGGRDHVKVLDFGISKFLETGGHTQRGMVFGTPGFMSPEQVSDPAGVDCRTDVYSLGVILYEMVGGKLPFEQAFPLIFSKILSEEPTPIESLRPDLPRELGEIIRKAMAKSLDERTASMDELGRALSRFAGLEPPLDAPARGTSNEDNEELGRMATVLRTPPPVRVPTGSGTPPIDSTPPLYAAILDAPRKSTPSEEQAVVGRSPRRVILAGAALLGALALALVAWAALGSGWPSTSARPGPAAPAVDKGPAVPPVVATVPPATPPAPPLPARVRLVVDSPVHGAEMTFRGETHRLPYSKEVDRSAIAEPLEVSASGHEPLRQLVTLDQERNLHVALEATRSSSSSSSRHKSSRSQERSSPGTGLSSSEKSPDSGAAQAPPPPASSPGEMTGGATAAPAAAAPAPAPAPEKKLERPSPIPSPPAAAAAPKPGTMDRVATQKAVRSHYARIEECVRRGRMDNPQLSGDVSVRIGISGSGQVASVRFTGESTLRSRPVEACIASEIGTWRLPAPAGGTETTIQYKWPFP
jgi:serine/threonine protein kinase